MKTARLILIILALLAIGVVIFGLVTKKSPFSKKQFAYQDTPSPYDLGLKKVSVAKNLVIKDSKEVIHAETNFVDPATLASKLNVNGNPDKTNANLWKWSDGKLSLVYNFPSKIFDLKDESNLAIRDLKDISDGEKTAQDFIKKTALFGQDINFKVKETVLLKGQEESGVTTIFKDANFIIVNFEIQFQGLPVFFESNRQAFLTVWLTKKARVFRLTGSLPLQIDKVTTTTIKSEQEARKQISNREGIVISVVQIEPADKGQMEDFSYQEANFSRGFLAYNTLGNKLLPIYVYVGTAKNRVGKSLQITAFIHALKKLP